MQQQYQQFQQSQQLQQLQQQSSQQQQQQPPISQRPSSQPPLSPDFVPETQPSPPPQPKKKKGKKTGPTHYHPRKGPMDKRRRRKVSRGMGGGFQRSNCAPKWKEQTEGTSQSSGLKRSRNLDATSQQSDGRTHIDINDDPIDFENEQPLRRPVGRNKAKKAASTSSNSSVMDMFGDKFDRYVQLQETKADVMTRMEQKMIEAQSSFQEAQETL
uniref:No apical meristem-associated C-terminal domain-containing protein n=1 Tax=Lactuca sativa TaxID=4236 RepID=A0A9R1XPM6_LACSA|nr:hypothetical protein LSAT_V11C200055260 [Lactuca sativa]